MGDLIDTFSDCRLELISWIGGRSHQHLGEMVGIDLEIRWMRANDAVNAVDSAVIAIDCATAVCSPDYLAKIGQVGFNILATFIYLVFMKVSQAFGKNGAKWLSVATFLLPMKYDYSIRGFAFRLHRAELDLQSFMGHLLRKKLPMDL